jgi:2-polyprenyl-6-hydroxyphenyl methylase/3-demethylubiquinone-9 3-methyltransferase
MIPALVSRLLSLPALNILNLGTSSIACKICQRPAPFFDVVDFNKCAGYYCFGPANVRVNYHRCPECGFLFTPFFDDWTEKDFSQFVYNDDYGLVDPEYQSIRPTMVAEHLAQVLYGFEDARILDYGAGSGLFAKRMAELGFFRVESYDPFSIPARPAGHFDIITCIEVIEHSPKPVAMLQDMQSLLTGNGCIILGETLQPIDINTVRCNWWYVAPRNGHASTFADRTLATVAEQLGLIFHRGASYHVLRKPPVGPFAEMAERFGPAILCFRLRAPAEETAAGFHGLEGIPGQQFRWSAADSLTWRVTVPEGPSRRVQVSIPYLHESRRDFAGTCRIDVGSTSASVALSESAIFAEADGVAPGPVHITLWTPELTEPTTDPRRIGLAIEVAQEY